MICHQYQMHCWHYLWIHKVDEQTNRDSNWFRDILKWNCWGLQLGWAKRKQWPPACGLHFTRLLFPFSICLSLPEEVSTNLTRWGVALWCLSGLLLYPFGSQVSRSSLCCCNMRQTQLFSCECLSWTHRHPLASFKLRLAFFKVTAT